MYFDAQMASDFSSVCPFKLYLWQVPMILRAFPQFLAQDISSHALPALALKSAVSPRSPGAFWWRMTFSGKIWALGLSIATEVSVPQAKAHTLYVSIFISTYVLDTVTSHWYFHLQPDVSVMPVLCPSMAAPLISSEKYLAPRIHNILHIWWIPVCEASPIWIVNTFPCSGALSLGLVSPPQTMFPSPSWGSGIPSTWGCPLP